MGNSASYRQGSYIIATKFNGTNKHPCGKLNGFKAVEKSALSILLPYTQSHTDLCPSVEPCRPIENSVDQPKECSKISAQEFDWYEALGTGSFGEVRLAKHRQTQKWYAVKSMQKAKVVIRHHVKHVNNEREVLGMLNFPFIVRLCYTCQDASRVYLVLEYVDGGDMFGLLRIKRRFSENAARFYAAQVVLALEYIHDLDIVYRDLKPENILIDKNGYLKLADFGFAKRVPKRTYTLCGTPEYMAPEIILQRGYGTSVDWWSFGVLLYEMITGYSPFEDAFVEDMYEKIVNVKYTFPIGVGMSQSSKHLIKNLLQADLTRRLGVMKNGVVEIRHHAWFGQTSWDEILQQKIQPIYKPLLTRTIKKRPVATPYNIPNVNEYSNLFPNF